MNTGVHVSFLIMVFSGYMRRSGIVGSYVSFVHSFSKNPHTVYHGGCISLYSPNRAIPFLHTFSSIYCLKIFLMMANMCEMIPHCSFDLHFSNNKWCWASFHVFISYLYVFYIFIIFQILFSYILLQDTEGISWWSNGQDSVLSLPMAQVQSLVRELRSHKLWGIIKSKKQGIEYSSLCYTVRPCCLFILYIVVYIY